MKQYILDMEAQLRSIENQMKSADDTALETLMKKYSDLNHEFELNNGYAYKSEITGVLKGLGFAEEDFTLNVNTLSGGQKTRVALGRLLLSKPDIILLDEPTAMLDPHGRDEVMKTVKMLNEQGVTIVLITHYMEEAAQAQRVVVIDGGEVIMDNVPKKIFSNVETMKNLGLDVPQVTELCWELKKAGYDISTEIIHEDECVQKLYEMLK